MPKSIIITSGSSGAAVFPADGTVYVPYIGHIGNPTITESNVKATIRRAGIASYLTIFLTANSVTATSTARLRKNGANTALVVSMTASTTGNFEDTTNTDNTIVAGDDLNYSIVTGATGTSINVNRMSFVFDQTDDTTITHTKLGSNLDGASFASASSSTFCTVIGGTSFNTTESNVQRRIKKAGSLKFLDVRILTNARTTATTIITRKNGADGAQSVSIGSTATGKFEDTTNTDTVATDDLFDYKLTTGTGTQSITIHHIACSFESSTTDVPLIISHASSGITSTSSPRYFPAAGNVSSTLTTETDALTKIRLDGVISNLSIHVGANTTTVATGRLRINQANSSLSVSIGSGATGHFEDTTNTGTIASGDIVTYSITYTSGTSLTVRSIQSWIDVTSAQLYQKSITETSISVSESLARVAIYTRPISESSVSVSETLARIQMLIKTLSEPSITVSETLARIATFPRPISDTPIISVSESLARVQTLIKLITNEPEVTTSEIVTRLTSMIRTLSEPSQSISEDLARIQSIIKLISETPSIDASDSVTAGILLTVSLLESRIKWYYSLLTRKIPEGET